MDYKKELLQFLTCRLNVSEYDLAEVLLDHALDQVFYDEPSPLRLTADKSTAVNPDTFWQEITATNKPLEGAKYLLINKAAGVAQIAPYRDDGWYTHFAGLPKFP